MFPQPTFLIQVSTFPSICPKLMCPKFLGSKFKCAELFAIKGSKIQIEKQSNIQIIRCYSYQTYGHIAKNSEDKHSVVTVHNKHVIHHAKTHHNVQIVTIIIMLLISNAQCIKQKNEDLTKHIEPSTEHSNPEASITSCSSPGSMVPIQ